MHAHTKRALAVLLACLAANPAVAALYCVNSAASYTSALADAAASTVPDTIRIVGGDYALTSGGSHSNFGTGNTGSLLVDGGWAAGCASRSQVRTRLDGQNTVRALRISSPAASSITIRNIDFLFGLSTNNRGGGLSISTDNDVVVEGCYFIGNRADDFAGALSIGTAGTIKLRNNVFAANDAAVSGAIELVANGAEAWVISNTIVGNRADVDTAAGGLRIGGGAHFTLSNNILWNNTTGGAPDLKADSSHTRLHNDIGTSTGMPGDVASVGNVSVEPQFTPCGFLCLSISLARSSPLVDTGINAAPGGLSTTDIFGKPRIIATTVDIGAHELDELFIDGFD